MQEQFQDKINRLRQQFHFDFVSLALPHGTTQKMLTWQWAAGNLNGRWQRIVLAAGKGVAGLVYQSGRTMLIQDANHEIPREVLHEYPIISAEQLVSLCAMPLWQGQEVQGVLLAAFRQPVGFDQQLYQSFLEQTAVLFADFAVPNGQPGAPFPEMVRQARPEPVPVYELMTYHIIKAQEEERRRISRELHDSVVQELCGIQMELRLTKYLSEQSAVLETVQRAEEKLSRVQDHLRRMSVELRPVALDDLGLAAAFRSHFHWVGETQGVMVDFAEYIEDARFPMEVETVFYRVGQEAVMNACKYAGCDEIQVTLSEAHGRLCLTVQDDGSGFDLQHLKIRGTGIGLLSMRERAELIEGELMIETAPGKGTKIILVGPELEGGIADAFDHCR